MAPVEGQTEQGYETPAHSGARSSPIRAAGARHRHHRYANTFLYSGAARGKAIRYGIGVGRDGFRWFGHAAHHPRRPSGRLDAPREMIAAALPPRFHGRWPDQPARPARAMYFGNTIYRITAPMRVDHRPARLVRLHPPHQ